MAFSRAWSLAVDNPMGAVLSGMAGATEPGATETALRRLFSPRVLGALALLQGLSVRSRGGRLAVWRGDGFVTGEARVDLLADALVLRQALLSGRGAVTPGAVEPPPDGGAFRVRVRRLIGSAGGGTLGLSLEVPVRF